MRHFVLLVIASIPLCIVAAQNTSAPGAAALGIFDAQSDVGSVTPPGKSSYDAATRTYTIDSAGDDLWAAEDDFHFVWKKMTGDITLAAGVNLPSPPVSASRPNGNSDHRKAVLMFRQSLDSDAVYVDAALHGNGETALQYRDIRGGKTHSIEFNKGAPRTLRLEKRGDTMALFISQNGEPLHQAGASTKLHIEGLFYVGLGVCAHNKNAAERATFANVELTPTAPIDPTAKMALYSSLQTISIDPNLPVSKVVLTERSTIQAPNWTHDGKTLIFTRDGKLWTIPVEGGEAKAINLGGLSGCTGSHGLSPDGQWMAVTCMAGPQPGPRIYIVRLSQGVPRMLTDNPNSWFHSWSADGKTIAFSRPSQKALNICVIPVEGGTETCLTEGTGISDDPDYSPDGKYIYFNSNRSGGMEIWRMLADGSQPEQVTFDGQNNWTAHPSPDGESIVILSYGRGVTGHPANKDVTLRILSAKDGKIRDLVRIVGGNGTDNVANWAPDSKHFAFVSYEMLPESDPPAVH